MSPVAKNKNTFEMKFPTIPCFIQWAGSANYAIHSRSVVGRGARGNRTPAVPALFSVTPTFLPRSACRPATSAVTSAAATAASARNGLTLFLWGAGGAQRGVSCNAQCVGLTDTERIAVRKRTPSSSKVNSGRSNRTRRKAPLLVHLVPRSGKRGISFCQRARPALGIKFFLIRKSPAIRSSNLISGR